MKRPFQKIIIFLIIPKIVAQEYFFQKLIISLIIPKIVDVYLVLPIYLKWIVPTVDRCKKKESVFTQINSKTKMINKKAQA